MQDILDVARQPEFDTGIIRWTYHPYTPYNTLTINPSDEVRICINNQDLLTLPSQSYLYIKGKVDNKDNGHFIKNGLAFLFDEIRYEIASREVDSVRNPGMASLMKYMCTVPANSAKRYTNALMDTDNNLKKISSNGEFSGCIPMEMLLGVFEDFDKVLVNVKQELVLKMARNSLNAVYTTATAPAAGVADSIPEITISEIQWFMPHILASDKEKLTLYKTVNSSKPFHIKFRSHELHEMPSYPTSTTKHTWAVKTTSQVETPRYVILGFQTSRDNAARKRCDEFDSCTLKNAKVFLNSEYYPYADMNLDFEKNDVSKAYEMFVRLQQSYQNMLSEPIIDREEFAKKYPLIAIDCSKQNEAIKEGVIDMRIEIETSANMTAGTKAYCLIIHNKQFEYDPSLNTVSRV